MSLLRTSVTTLLIAIAFALNACGGDSDDTVPAGNRPPGGSVPPLVGGPQPPGVPGGSALVVADVDPPADTVGASLSGPIAANFNNTLGAASISSATFVVNDDLGNAVAGTVTASGSAARFTPLANALKPATIYRATLRAAIVDATGKMLGQDFSWNFTTTTDAWQRIPINASTPTARASHTAVWTGSEMIVWGGDDSSALGAIGGRYDPSADTWTATAASGAPTSRTQHTAVWTGSEMIVWGGFDFTTGVSNTGGRFHPDASFGTWSPTASTTALARAQHTAIWTGSEMIVWGGLIDNNGLTNTGARFNPLGGGSWLDTSLTGAPTARVGHTAVWTGTEMIVWGGDDANGPTNTGARYRPSNDTWTSLPTTGVPSARFGHSAIWTGSDMIIWGGNDGALTNTGARYSPTTNTWSNLTVVNAPSARAGHTAVWTGAEMIVWGGDQTTNAGAAYNPLHDAWRPTASDLNTPNARAGHSAVWTGSEMLIWGGNDSTTTASGARYSP